MNHPELTAQLKHLYGFGTVQILGRIEGGYWSEVLSLTTDRGSFALLRYHPGYVPQGVQWEHGLMHFLGSTIPQVPVPVEQIDGSTHFVDKGRVAALFPLMGGHHPDSLEAMEAGAARMMAQLHRAGLGYPERSPRPGMPSLNELDWDHNWMWNWDEVVAFMSRAVTGWAEGLKLVGANAVESLEELANRIGQIESERSYCQSLTIALVRDGRLLTRGPIHGDYYPGNLLVEGGRITAVLDWDECRPDWQCYELARASWEFFQDQSSYSFDKSWALSFLEEYQEAGGPVPAAEFELLVPFMRCALLQDLLFEISEAIKGKAWEVTYSVSLLRSLENLTTTRWPD